LNAEEQDLPLLMRARYPESYSMFLRPTVRAATRNNYKRDALFLCLLDLHCDIEREQQGFQLVRYGGHHALVAGGYCSDT
jgi:hypothetical protein